MARRDLVELGENGLLDLHLLGDRLDDEVDLAEALVLGGARDQPEDLLGAGSACSCGDLLLVDQARELALGNLARLGQPSVHEVLLDVLHATGTSAEAITWAISPPIVPAPSTAALNTNMHTPQGRDEPSLRGAERSAPGG